MIRYCLINGVLTDAAQASIGLSDLGLLRGYGIFDYFLVRRGMPMFFDDYLDRFSRSAALLGLELPVSLPELKAHIFRLLEANGLSDTAIRLLLTGGYAEDSYTPTHPNWIVMQHPMPQVPARQHAEGIKLMLYRHVRELPEVKSTNYLTGIRIREALKSAGAPEVLYHDGRCVSESARSNFYIITQEGVLVTPRDKVLHGVTRKQVLQSAREIGIPVEERELLLTELPAAAETFLTSTLKGVLPVVQIDELRIGSGAPGPISTRLGEAFRARVEAYLQQQNLPEEREF
ncbi:MAG: aminotransferase class IV [Saprospiraceae bacterium]|nr:aminotransferase class IV [Saprospiraceae bacterium]